MIFMNKRIVEEAGACMRAAWYRIKEDRQTEASETEQILLWYGDQVGENARILFHGGKLIDADTFTMALKLTQIAMCNGEPILFEPAFSYRGLAMKADILVRLSENEYELIEIKAGTKPEEYVEDVAIQTWILQQLGMTIRPSLLLLNRASSFANNERFIKTDCSDAVELLLPSIDKRIRNLWRDSEMPDPPKGNVTRHCRDCDFLERCFPDLPEHHVFTLFRGGKRIDALLERGVTSLHDTPRSIKLESRQRIQLNCIASKSAWASKSLSTALADVAYPMFFLDFEVAHEPLPRFADYHPYDQIPFQWSCHVRRRAGATLEHYDCLITEPGDPRPEFAVRLLNCLGQTGSIVMYTTCEKTIIKYLADCLPGIRENLLALVPRMYDLHQVIAENYYHPSFHGSLSLKKVLPVLVPELSYAGMPIGDGMTACLAYQRIRQETTSDIERERLCEALRDYCKLDTLAMVRVYDRLLEESATARDPVSA